MKWAAALTSVAPDLEIAFAAQGRTLSEYYGSGDELFGTWFRMDDPSQELSDAIDAFQPDVIHSHNLPDSLTVMVHEIVGGRIPVVHDVHDMQGLRTTPYEDGYPDPTDPAEMERRASEQSDAVITVSDEVLIQLERRYALPSTTGVFPNAPLQNALPATIPPPDRPVGNPPRIVYQGSLSDNNSHYDLQENFAVLAESGLDLTIRPARPTATYQKLAERIGARYVDPVSPPELMKELPHYDWGWAGFNESLNKAHIDTALPNKAFEYLACGLPILTLPHAALARFVKDHGVGIVLDHPRDAADAIAEADVVALRRRVAEVRTHYTAERNAEGLLALYQSLVSQRRSDTVEV